MGKGRLRETSRASLGCLQAPLFGFMHQSSREIFKECGCNCDHKRIQLTEPRVLLAIVGVYSILLTYSLNATPHISQLQGLSDCILIRWYQLQEYTPGADLVVVHSFLLNIEFAQLKWSEQHTLMGGYHKPV